MESYGRVDYEEEFKEIKIDLKDKKILTLLAQDSRMPLTQIAKNVGLSRDAVDYRIKRLESNRIILSFIPVINFETLGYFNFHVFALIDELDKEAQKNFIKMLTMHENVISVIEYTDRWDLEVNMIARNLREFDNIIMEIVGKYPDIILEKDKLEIIKKYNKTYLPPLLDSKTENRVKRDIIPEIQTLDEVDKKILKILLKDARTSTYSIGDQIGLSPDAATYRIKNMISKSIIENFSITVNYSRLKYHWYTLTTEMKIIDHRNENKFKNFVKDNRNILYSSKTLGGWDLFMYLIIQNPKEFHKIIKDIKNIFSDVIKNYQTWIAYKEHRHNPIPDIIFK